MININNVSSTLRCTCTSFVTPRLQLGMNVLHGGTLAIEKVQCSVWMEAVTTPAYVELWGVSRTLERTVL